MEVKVLVVLPQPFFHMNQKRGEETSKSSWKDVFPSWSSNYTRAFQFFVHLQAQPKQLEVRVPRGFIGRATEVPNAASSESLPTAHPFRWTTRAWNFHAMLLESKRRECRALRCPIGWQKSNSQQHNCTAIVGVNRRFFWVPSLNIWLSKVVTQKQSDSASTKHLKKLQNVQILTKFVAKS